jgi:hypothetical protein
MGPPSLSGAGVRRGLRFAGALSVRAGLARPAGQTGRPDRLGRANPD